MSNSASEDDPSIRDECELLRRIPLKENVNIVWDGNEKRWRPSSAAFQDHPDGSSMSVVLGDVLNAAGRDVVEVLTGHENFGLAAITAGFARECNQRIAKDPLPEEPAHGLVVGNKPRRVSRELAKAAKWVIAPGNYLRGIQI